MAKLTDIQIRAWINPTDAFEVADAGGQEKSRKRWLTHEELIQFFQAMRMAKGFSREKRTHHEANTLPVLPQNGAVRRSMG